MEKLEDEYENLWNLALYLTVPYTHGGLFTPSETAPSGGHFSRAIKYSHSEIEHKQEHFLIPYVTS